MNPFLRKMQTGKAGFVGLYPKRFAVAGALLCAFVGFSVGCRPAQQGSQQGATHAAEAASPQTAAQVETPATQGKQEMTSLQSILDVFSNADTRAWSAFDSVPGVQWNQSGPEDNPSAKPEYRRSRGGKLLLVGFGETDLPNGKVGAEAASVRGNEGESGVTLNGDADQVNSIAVMKFYASQDYASILKNQFVPDTAIALMAKACAGEDDPESREFYRIAMPGTAPVYAEIYVDAEGGKYNPGSTTFEFYRSEPADRIKSMGCAVVGKN